MGLSKLMNRSIKKIFSDYLIYFITICLCASLFFVYLTFSSKNNLVFRGNYFYVAEGFTKVAIALTYVVSFIFLGLIYYVNNSILKQQSKGFSVYMTLGTSKEKIIKRFLLETYIIGILAALIGCILGTIFAAFLSGFVSYYISGEFAYKATLYIDVFLKVIVYFSIVFLIIGIFNSKRLKDMPFIEVINEEGVKEIKDISKVKYILCLAFTSFCFLAPIITYNNQEYMKVINQLPYIYELLPAFLPYLSIYAGYYILSYLIKLLIDRMSKTNLKNFNFILFNNLFERIRYNIKSIGTMTIVLTIATYILILAPITIKFTEDRLSYDLIFDSQDRIYNKAILINDVFSENYAEFKTKTLTKKYKSNDLQSLICGITVYNNNKIIDDFNTTVLENVTESRNLTNTNLHVLNKNNIEVHNLEENKPMIISTGMYMLFIGISIIFFIMAFTILTMQQLTDARRNKKKYVVLYKMGMDKLQINKLIDKQVFTLFIIPYAFGGICSIHLLITFYFQWKDYIYTYIGIEKFISSILCGFSIILVIFLIYYMASTFMYKNIIKDEFEK